MCFWLLSDSHSSGHILITATSSCQGCQDLWHVTVTLCPTVTNVDSMILYSKRLSHIPQSLREVAAAHKNSQNRSALGFCRPSPLSSSDLLLLFICVTTLLLHFPNSQGTSVPLKAITALVET